MLLWVDLQKVSAVSGARGYSKFLHSHILRGADTQMHNRALSFAASDASGPADHAVPEAGGDGEGEQRQ